MEITFEEPYDDVTDSYQDYQKKRILLSLNNEKLNRKPQKIQEEHNKNSYNDSLLSPLSIEEEENRPLDQSEVQIYKIPLSKYSTFSNSYSQKPKGPTDTMHKQMKQPDFNKISQIYSAYSKENEQVSGQRRSFSKTPPASRPSSAPLARKNIVQELLKERENEFKKNCTFKPKINRNSESLKNNELTMEQKILMLSRPKSEQHEKREKLRRELEDLKHIECTFKPNIMPYRGSVKSSNDYPVEERLYQDAEFKNQERERMQRLRQEELASNYPFRPQVQMTASKLVGNKKERPPIYQRLEELQKEKNNNRNIMRLEAEQNDPDLTFKPKINQNSYMLAHARKQRNSSETDTKCSKNRHNSEQLSFNDKYAFTPKTTPKSNSSTAQEFLERQKYFQERSNMKKEQSYDFDRLKEWNFTPEIDRVSKFIAENNKSRTGEKVEVRLMKEHEKNRENKKKLADKYYSTFTYEPMINQISKNIARSTSLSEISNNSFSLAMKKKLAEEKALDEERKNSFTPKITKTKMWDYVNSSYKQGYNLTTTIREKFRNIEKKREEVKKVQEFEEMRECTFMPHHACRSSLGDGKVQVKGIERFMELKNISRRREEEARQRERKVFIQSPKNRGESFYTVPRPFNLHPSNKKQKVEKLREELMKKEQSECVFQPKIKE